MEDKTPLIPAHDTLAIEAEARRLRAEFMADCFATLSKKVAALLDTNARDKVRG